MSNKEKEVWNGVGTKWYLDENGNPKGRFVDPSTSDYEFSLIGFPKNVLEIGIGVGRDIKRFQDLGAKVSGIDISEKFIEMANNNYKGTFVVGDARDVPQIFKNSSFDLIYSRWSLIHLSIKELEKLLSSIGSILTNKGIFLVSLRAGKDYNQTNKTTKIRSLQMNLSKLNEIIPSDLRISHSERRPVKTTESDDDFAFTFVLRKNNPRAI